MAASRLLPLLALSGAFRVYNDNQTYTIFTPYEEGFVGRTEDARNLKRERVNEGSPSSPDVPVKYDVFPRQICPGMVGPLGDGEYYCLAKEYGYCDRRSGTCLCNVGYEGLDCGTCSPTHFALGELCYPKKLCPNDCSGAGACNHTVGACACAPGRTGEDCSVLRCSHFDPLCAACTDDRCVRCEPGYSVGSDSRCEPCWRFDARCVACDAGGCLECADPLLNAVAREAAELFVSEALREYCARVETASMAVSAIFGPR